MKKHIVILSLIGGFLITPISYAQAELTVYSSRNASYLKPLFDNYSRETGVSVRYLVGPVNALISRLQLEGDKSTADVFFTTGAENLWKAEQLNLLLPIKSRTLDNNVARHLKSSKNQWFGLSKRVRTLAYNPKVTSVKELDSYQALGNEKWQGKLCMRSANDDYTQGLIAQLIASNGLQATATMLRGWVANLAVKPLPEDVDILRAIDKGQCEVGIVNSYYLARYKLEAPKTPIKLFWANQSKQGVQVNITGAGVVKSSKNKSQAQDLIEWLSTKEPQVQYAKLSMEYPVHPKVYPDRSVARWGKFRESKQNVGDAGKYKAQAIELLRQAKYQ